MTLVHFLWEGGLLALILCGAAALTKNARVRYAVGLFVLALMAAAPFVTAAVLSGGDFIAGAQLPKLRPALSGFETAAGSIGQSPLHGASFFLALNWQAALVDVWFLGIALLSIRAAGGYVGVQRLTRTRCHPLESDLLKRCQELQARLGLRRAIRFLESQAVSAPAVVGWLKPAVLLPASALSGLNFQQLEAVVLHELAHIRRLDYLVNIFQIAVETVLFYHPAVWWASNFVRVEREHCCDDAAVGLTGDAGGYARALVLMERWRSGPVFALGATGGNLKGRVVRLLHGKRAKNAFPQSRLAAVAMLCLTGVALSVAAAPEAVPAVPQVVQPVSSPIPQAAPPLPPVPRAPVPPAKPAAEPEPPEPPDIPELSPDPPEPPDPPEAMLQHHDDQTVDYFAAWRLAGITEAYRRDMRATGLNFSSGDLVALKSLGVTPAYVRRMQAAGWRGLAAHQIITLKAMNVNPMEAAAFQRDFGPGTFSLNNLIAFTTQGVTPQYISALRAAGLKDLSAGSLIGAKAMGITPEFIAKVKAHGFHDLSIHQLIRLKASGVF